MEFNRFEFEQQIMKVWNLIEMLNTVSEGVLEYEWNEDQTVNALNGIAELYDLEMNKLFSMFETGIKQGKIV